MTEKKLFYNEERKQEFLNSIDNPLVQTFATYPLKKAKNTEELYGKDLYEMNLNEIEEVLSDFTCTSLSAIINYTNKVEEYIGWAIKEGYRKSNINPLSSKIKTEYCKRFVATSRNYYFTRDEIVELMHDLDNEMDQVVLLALFEGIKGKAFSEILNLKVDDIEEDGEGGFKITLYDEDKTPRQLPISKLLKDVMEHANGQTSYVNKNGEDEELEITSYVLKKAKRGKQGGRLNFTYINRKFLIFKEQFGLEHLKSKHIIDSGIMHMANEMAKDNTLTSQKLKDIADHFDTTYTAAPDGVRYRNTTVIKRIIEIDSFEELYGYKMNFKTKKKQEN